MIGIIFWGTQLLVTYLGLRMILIHNSLTTSQLLICAINMHDIMWATRCTNACWWPTQTPFLVASSEMTWFCHTFPSCF